MTKEFYRGREARKEEIKEIIPQARDIHLTGKEGVALGVELDLVDSRRILYVKKVPHAEVVRCE